jgi:hypothetical protein
MDRKAELRKRAAERSRARRSPGSAHAAPTLPANPGSGSNVGSNFEFQCSWTNGAWYVPPTTGPKPA